LSSLPSEDVQLAITMKAIEESPKRGVVTAKLQNRSPILSF